MKKEREQQSCSIVHIRITDRVGKLEKWFPQKKQEVSLGGIKESFIF